MGKLSDKLRSVEGGCVSFWCPGCDEAHVVRVDASQGPAWGYNQNPDKPTFTPSVLVRCGHYIPGHNGDCWCTYRSKDGSPSGFKCKQCHSFVTDGRVQFLSDSTHKLAGQTVDLPDWPYGEN